VAREGGLPGGLVSYCRNIHSGALYWISTVFQDPTESWTTAVFRCTERRSWFGVVRRQAPDLSAVLRTYFRNAQAEAHQVHTLVEQMVQTEQEDSWDLVEPDLMPPDGFNEVMERDLEAKWGDSLSPEIRARFRTRG